jgi:predicted transcriptional regulator
LKNLPKSVCKKLRTRGFIMRTRLNRNGCFSLTDKCVNILEEARP